MGAWVVIGIFVIAWILWRIAKGGLNLTWRIGQNVNDAYWDHQEISAAGSHGPHGVQKVREKRARARLWFWGILVGAILATFLVMVLDT